MRENMHVLIRFLDRFDKPVIAAVNGAAVAGGLTLALACDFRIAAESAKLGDTSLKFALIPDEGGAYFFPRFMGLDRALKMSLLSEVYTARQAMELGLVTEVVADDQLMTRARELAARLAEGPPIAIRITKRMMYKQRCDAARQCVGRCGDGDAGGELYGRREGRHGGVSREAQAEVQRKIDESLESSRVGRAGDDVARRGRDAQRRRRGRCGSAITRRR